MMGRSSKAEQARRLNTAWELLQARSSPAQTRRILVCRYGVSQRQAYRYLQQARQARAPVAVPQPEVGFSVKLPQPLVAQLHRQARAQGCALKVWVDRALQRALELEDYG